jgi:hypothetical protein
MSTNATSRRDFLKKTAYVAPLVLTMNVSLAEAQVGSSRQEPSEERVLISSASDGGSRHARHAFRGRGHAWGRLRRDDD